MGPILKKSFNLIPNQKNNGLYTLENFGKLAQIHCFQTFDVKNSISCFLSLLLK